MSVPEIAWSVVPGDPMIDKILRQFVLPVGHRLPVKLLRLLAHPDGAVRAQGSELCAARGDEIPDWVGRITIDGDDKDLLRIVNLTEMLLPAGAAIIRWNTAKTEG